MMSPVLGKKRQLVASNWRYCEMNHDPLLIRGIIAPARIDGSPLKRQALTFRVTYRAQCLQLLDGTFVTLNFPFATLACGSGNCENSRQLAACRISLVMMFSDLQARFSSDDRMSCVNLLRISKVRHRHAPDIAEAEGLPHFSLPAHNDHWPIHPRARQRPELVRRTRCGPKTLSLLHRGQRFQSNLDQSGRG